MLTPVEWSALWMSLLVGAVASALTLIPGIGLGWVLARKSFPGRVILEAVVFLPLIVPPVVTGYILLVILGRNGVVGSFLEDAFGIRLAFTWFAMAIAGALVGLPFLVRAVRLSIESIPDGLEEASRTLGFGAWGTFFRVTLPLARPGIITGGFLAFARALGEFGATVMVAPNIDGTRTLALEIYRQALVPGGEATVARLAGISIALSFVALLATDWFTRRTARRRGR